MHGVAHDFGNRIAAFQIIVLKDKTYLFIPDFICLAFDAFAVYVNLAAVLFIQPADDVEQCRFSAAALTVYGYQSRFGKFKTDALQHFIAVAGMSIKDLFYIFYSDLCHHFDPLFKLFRIDVPRNPLLNPNATTSTIISIINSMKI